MVTASKEEKANGVDHIKDSASYKKFLKSLFEPPEWARDKVEYECFPHINPSKYTPQTTTLKRYLNLDLEYISLADSIKENRLSI